MAHFKADDAYAAALLDDGSVVIIDLSDPALTPVIVAEFTAYGGDYHAFWHDDLNRWEVFGPDEFYRVCDASDPFWGFCEQTVGAFRDRLLRDNAGNNRLSRKLARSIQEEIDAEIIRDLMIASGQYVPPPPPVPQLTIGPPKGNRILVSKWTIEPEQDLRKLHGIDDLVGRSLLKAR